MGEEGGGVRGAWRRYVDTSSGGGVRRAALPPPPARLLWALVIAACCGVAVFSVVRLVQVRKQRYQAVTSGLDETRSVTFPDVTVCDVRAVHLAVVWRSQKAEYGRTARQADVSWNKLVNTNLLNQPLNSQSESDNRAYRYHYQTLVDQMTSAERRAAGFNLSLSLQDCTLGDIPCNASNFTWFYHHKFGNCFTFTPHPSPHHIVLPGQQQGLMLELLAETQDISQEEAGFVIGVHQSRDTPFLSAEGVFVPPSSATYIAISRDERSWWTDCMRDVFTHNSLYTAWSYSQRGCQHGCLQRALIERCGCCDIDLPCPFTFIYPFAFSASPDQVAGPRCFVEKEMRCRGEVIQDYRDGSLPCLGDCKPRCSYTHYKRRVSTTSLKVLPVAMLPDTPEPPTEDTTETPTEDTTQPPTEDTTQPPTKTTTQLPTRNTTQLTTRNTTQPPTEDTTQPPTEDTTQPPTEDTTQPPTEDTTQPAEGNLIGLPIVGVPSLLGEVINEASRRKRHLSEEFPNPDNVARIYVYFEELRSTVTETRSEIDWTEWLADVGGLLSLWLGVSILAVLEVLHFLLDLFLLPCKGAQTPTMVKPFTP